jgi:hypothetical protein
VSAPAAPGTEGAIREVPARTFPWRRALAAVALLAAAGAAVLWLRAPEDLALEARFDPASPAPGSRGRLVLRVSPGPGAAGEVLGNVRADVDAPGALVFDRSTQYLLPDEAEMVLGFAVDQRAAPGPRRVAVTVAAELPAGEHRSVKRTAELRRELVVTVAAPAPGRPEKP